MKLHYLFILIFLFLGCEEEKKCQYSPAPIFKPEWEKVVTHKFERNKSKATETVTFPNGVKLELFQTICNNTQQEYHFYLKGNFRDKPDPFWITETANQFYYMAGVGREVQGSAQWGQLIQDEFSKFTLGEELEIQPSIFIKIDKLIGTTESQLIIRISQIVE